MRNRSARLTALAMAVFLPLLAAAAFWVDSLREGEDQLIGRRYEEAIISLERALEEVPEASEDRVLLLLGRAYLLAGRAEEAIPVYQRLVRENPGSTLVHRARFQEADSLIDAGRSRQAAQIYRDEIERLTGLDRKEEVAATYLSLAEQALSQDPPDHSRAVTFYDLALDLGLSPAKSRAVRLIAGQALLQTGRAADAITRLEPLVDELQRGQGRLRAMLALGRARLMAGDRSGARRVLGDLRSFAPDAPESADAAYQTALSYGVPQPSAADLDRAVTALQELGARYPEHGKAKVAQYLAALCYQFRGRSQDALESLEQFLESQGDSGLEEVASARALVGQVLAGQGRLQEAISAWRAYLTAHPSHAQWEQVQRAIVDTEYRRALEAYVSGEQGFGLARELFAAFGRAHPLDARNPEILYLLGDMFLQEESHDLARAAFARCVSKYPGKESSSHAQFAIGEIHESVAFNYLDALKAYRAVTWGSWAGPARQRIARLERKSLSLLTPRIYHTDETPVFEVTSRNIKKVRVRVYRLELEDYFRATHTAGQVERLDIEVIESDKTFDDVVPEYQQYQETTRDVDIEFREPGAYVVKVDDQDLEATTMVLVSDIALIAKSSRHEFFVFSENTKENRVEGGMKVVLSDGEKVIAEGVTGADGVWRYKGEELKNSDDLRVFAVNAAGSGASSLNLTGMGYSVGLTAKGYLFTDRPVYQPGQPVHIKGIVREVADGIYKLPTEEGYRVQVHSAAGRLILQRPVRFTEFGTFAVDLVLPGSADLGQWRLLVDRGDVEGEVFTATFQVARYERPRLSLTVDLEEPVVFRGEQIEGRLKLEYFFGEPAVGKELTYSLLLPDGSRIERRGETNAAGEVPFSFATVEFGEEAMAIIYARVPAENAATQIAVPVVTTEFVPTLSTVRSVYLAGESFDIELHIADRSGKPLAREATAVLLRLESAEPRAGLQQRSVPVVEVEVARQDVTTDAEGRGRVSFQAEEGGRYRVRVEARDRFDRMVTGEVALTVSGDDDEVKLRLLSDRQSYKVGETVRVKVANRATERLVLETIQGDGILAYRSYLLPRGEGELELTLEPLHAPNFSLSLTMVDGGTLHLAEQDFRVTRDLQVEVAAAVELVAPGEELEVTVTTTDPRGRPVSAEVSLAMVDESLLALFPETAPPMGVFFYGKLRETAFRTVSSCTWSYRGEAGYVSSAILAEERRLEEAIDELRDVRAGVILQEAEEEPLVQDAEEEPLLRTPGGELDTRYFALGRPLTEQQSQRRQARISGSDDFLGMAGAGGRFGGRGGAGGQPDGILRLKNGLAQDLRSALGGYLATNAVALAPNEPRTNFSETGAWISSVVTDGEGNARVKIEMPHSTTAWRINARAVTADTYVGEGTGRLRTAVDLQADLVLPLVLTEGDQTEVGARIHNLTDRDMDVETEFVVRRGDEERRETRQVEVGAHREAEPLMVLTAEEAVNLELALTARTGDLTDELRRTVPVQPFGMEFRTGRSGTIRQEDAFELSLPEGREYTRLELLLEVGHEPGRDLVSAALGLGYRPGNSRVVDRTNLSMASRGLSALVVLDDLERGGGSKPVDRTQLVGLLQAVMAVLQSSQQDDGSLTWVGGRRSDRRTTAQAVRFFGGARRRGLPGAEETANRAAEWLLQQLRTARTEDRPDLLWALASVDRARFESLNSLHRVRHDLSADGMARLALAWQAMERPALAGEVLDVLRLVLVLGRAVDPASVITVALAARALLAADPTDALGVRAVDWLRSVRRGASWGTPQATAAALAALTSARREVAGTARAGEIVLSVNGHEVATIPPQSAGRTVSFSVPSEWLQDQGNKVRLQVAGAAEVFYSATMTGFARGFRSEDQRSDLVSIQRRYLADFLRHDDRDLQPGFSVVQGRNIRTFENQITQMQVGQSARVRVQFLMPNELSRSLLTPLVVEEPIPAGCSVPRESIAGAYDHVVVEPHRLLFFYGEGRTSDVIQYEVQARFPGRYRALPTRAYGALRPDLLAHGDPATLRIYAAGTGEADPYRLTPDELYNLGKALFDGGQLEEAGQRFDQLLAEWDRKDWSLREDTFREVARMMLYVSVTRGDARNVARFFEELKDRHQDLVIPFDTILEVGKAYLDLGEFEAALLVFRATAEASFLKDAAVATTLEGLGEINASVLFLQDLLLAYPDLNTIRLSHYSIGQRLAALAAAIPDGAAVDARVGRPEELRTRALEAFREFLVLYPEDPLAEEVSFAWATTYLEAVDLQQALLVAEAALRRYPQSSFEDEFWYTSGYAHFALGEPEQAFAALTRVAGDDFTLPRGGRGPSENRFHAIYLQGQIHHALGQPAQALVDYQQVEDRFTDAAEAADYFLRKHISLPEVASFTLDEEPVITITYRNIEKLDVQVFRVDLMRLYLLEKSLNDIQGIQLHGIRPYQEMEVSLGDGRDYRSMEREITVELPEPGAYLVVARGGNLLASGMVLRSDLEIEAQESLDVGRIRVNVKQGESFLADAHVKVIGSGDGEFRSGDTDLRGIYVANQLVGRATVIVKKDDQYAFYRGEGIHQPARYRPPQAPLIESLERARPDGDQSKRFDALEYNLLQNDGNRSRQIDWLRNEVLNQNQQGVEVYRTKR